MAQFRNIGIPADTIAPFKSKDFPADQQSLRPATFLTQSMLHRTCI
jgi:hypothetical protein